MFSELAPLHPGGWAEVQVDISLTHVLKASWFQILVSTVLSKPLVSNVNLRHYTKEVLVMERIPGRGTGRIIPFFYPRGVEKPFNSRRIITPSPPRIFGGFRRERGVSLKQELSAPVSSPGRQARRRPPVGGLTMGGGGLMCSFHVCVSSGTHFRYIPS